MESAVRFLLLLLVACPVVARAQVSTSAQPVFETFDVRNGLPSSWVVDVTQDHDGYLWFGTHDGLARYDGADIVTYRTDPTDPGSIGGNDINSVLIDRDGGLWAGGEGSGLNHLPRGEKHFRRYRSDAASARALTSNDVFAIAETADRRIWVGCYGGGITILDSNGHVVGTVRHASGDAASLRSDNIINLHVDAKDRLWIGTDIGLDLRDVDGTIRHLDVDAGDHRRGGIIYTLLAEADGSMLVAMRHGLVRFDAQLQAEMVLPGEVVLSLLRDRDGTLWAGTRNGVMALRGDETVRFEPREGVSGLFPGRRVVGMHQDHEGGLWFATVDGGVGRLRPHWRNFSTWRHIPGDERSPTHALVAAVAVDQSSAWLVSGDDGLDHIDASDGRLTRWGHRLGKTGARLTAVLSDGDKVWVGHRGGIRIISKTAARIVDLNVDDDGVDALPRGPVSMLRKAPDGIVWALVLGGGVAAIDPASHRIERLDVQQGRLASADVRSMVVDRAGRVWLATAAGVEWHLPGSVGFQRLEGIASGSIDAMAVDGNDRLWLHDADGMALYRLVDGRLHREMLVGVEDGLPALAASALLVSDDGDVWMTSPRGLWRLNPPTRALTLFGDAAGLPSIEFSTGALAKQDGRIWAATRTGLVGFEPAALQTALPPPLVQWRSATVRRDGRLIELDPKALIRLDHRDRELTVQVRALSFADPSAHRYRFRMHGADGDWLTTGGRGERAFNRLDAGRYRLEAAASVGGDWVGVASPLHVGVAPAPWLTSWAFTGYALLLIVVGGGFALALQRRVARKHAMQLAVQRQKTAEQLVEVKSRFLASMSHEIRTPLTGVIGMAELLMESRLPAPQSGQVQSIHASGELLLRLVNDLVDLARIDAGRFAFEPQSFDPTRWLHECLALARPLAERRGLALNVGIDGRLPSWLVGDRQRIAQVLLNLVNNGLKFTEQGGVTVSAAYDGSRLRLVVADTGPGIAPELMARLFQRFEQASQHAGRAGGSGLGLAISRELVELMGGTILVDSTPGKGSRFDVGLPLQTASGDSAESPVEPMQAHSLSVLVVEDDVIVAAVIAGLLESLGHRCEQAGDGLAALARSVDRSPPFDLCLLDIDLPGISGLSIAGLLCERHGDAVPVMLAVTASITVDSDEAVAAGMDGLLRKPVTKDGLRDAIDGAMRRRVQARRRTLLS